MLAVEDLQIHYATRDGVVRAVDGASFAVPEGKIVGLVGESGCGKTTAVRAIMGVLAENGRRAGGTVVFKGKPIDEQTTRPLLWREIAYVPQSAMSSLDPVYTVGAQIVEVLTKRGGASRSAAKARAAELFELVGLSDRRLADYPHQFSGGMRQRAAIAMALALEPSLLLADEPVTALDVIVQRQILDMLREPAAAAEALDGDGDARHLGRRLSLRRGRGDVCRPGGRERPGARGAGPAAPSLHDGPAQRLPRPAVGRDGAGADPRQPARPARAT